ncbi:hypothetical protein niasHS_000912 [Heterodera schachtii]|uniref:Laminin EGF-like domain-containing protein n=1 Tax=Heterodera schachtii TaxID=97005 RepID=A0ABD2KI36_HETSC
MLCRRYAKQNSKFKCVHSTRLGLRISLHQNAHQKRSKVDILGNDALSVRSEIDEKYWYSISELDVQGSCFCHGHAQRCVPIGHGLSGAAIRSSDVVVVHDICECQHNTKGLNCEQCQDLYNDLPWRPGSGEQSKDCGQCECNGHATR